HDHANIELPPEGAIPEVILSSRLKGMSADNLDVACYLVRQLLRRHLDVSVRVAADLTFADVQVLGRSLRRPAGTQQLPGLLLARLLLDGVHPRNGEDTQGGWTI